MKKSIKKIPILPPLPCDWKDRNKYAIFNILICLFIVVSLFIFVDVVSIIIAITIVFTNSYFQNKRIKISDTNCKQHNLIK
jgi:hypothetical protein